MTKLNSPDRVNKLAPYPNEQGAYSWSLGDVAFSDPMELLGKNEEKRLKERERDKSRKKNGWI